MKNSQKTLLIFFLSCVVLSCDKKIAHPRPMLKSYSVHLSTLHKKMHFIGTVQPLKEEAVLSPMDALVETMLFHYGQEVKKGQTLFTVRSAELQRQYNDTLTDYLKAKDAYSVARAKYSGVEALWKAGIISKNNYLSEQSSLTSARVTFMQASIKLSELFEKTAEEQQDDLSKLSFSEFDRVRSVLIGKHNLIYIKAPMDGILLYPPKSDDNAAGQATVGMSVKSGQVLGFMGDLSGIRVQIDVPEVDINQIKIGMSARIKGIAFGKQELQGKLVAVNAQALPSSGGLPSFTAIIEVHSLTQEQQAWIKVGMSAEIALMVNNKDLLLIPVAAIQLKTGQSQVKVLASNGQKVMRRVTTGAVDVDKVVIESGLYAGDTVIYE